MSGVNTIGGSRDRSNCNYGITESSCPDPDAYCCSLSPCCLCIKYTTANGEITNAEACRDPLDNDTTIPSYTTEIYAGTIVLEWAKDQYGNCEFVVTYLGVVIARLDVCTEQFCKSPEGSVELENGDVIEWYTYLKPRRQVMKGSAGCEEVPCLACTCLCDRLCMIWRRDTGYATDLPCEYCDVVCDSVLAEMPLDEDCVGGGVVWGPIIFEPNCSDNIGPVSVSVALGTDEYGNCELKLIVDGEERATLEVDEAGEACKNVNLSASYIDDTGCVVTVVVECKKCGDPCFPTINGCGKGCCFTDRDCFDISNHIDTIPFMIEGLAGLPTVYGDFVQSGTGVRSHCGRCGCLEALITDSSTRFGISFLGQQCLGGFATSCGKVFHFALSCETDVTGDAAESGYNEIDTCASRLRLLVGTSTTPGFSGTIRDETGCVLFDPQYPHVSLPFDTVSCSPDGLTGSVSLDSVTLLECEQEAYAVCESPPNPSEIFSDNCCELFTPQPFAGATLTLLLP